MNFFLDLHTREHGYEEVWLPVVVNRASMTGTGQLPKFEDDMYALRDEDLFLIPTAEVPVTNLYRDEMLDASHAAERRSSPTSPCFRREAGSAGKDTRGLLRVHEFDKVELVRYCTPEQSARGARAADAARRDAAASASGFRIACAARGGRHGLRAARRRTTSRCGRPASGKWLEVSSCSTFTDFQARRANIRYRPAAGEKPRFVHTLNGSGLAFPRIIAACSSTISSRTASVVVPEVCAYRRDVL